MCANCGTGKESFGFWDVHQSLNCFISNRRMTLAESWEVRRQVLFQPWNYRIAPKELHSYLKISQNWIRILEFMTLSRPERQRLFPNSLSILIQANNQWHTK